MPIEQKGKDYGLSASNHFAIKSTIFENSKIFSNWIEILHVELKVLDT